MWRAGDSTTLLQRCYVNGSTCLFRRECFQKAGFFDEGIVFLDVVRTQRLDALRRRVVRDLSTEFGVRPNDL